MSVLYPTARPAAFWQDTPDALPVGQPTKIHPHGIAGTVAFPGANSDVSRVLKRPDTFEPTHVAQIFEAANIRVPEEILISHHLTEWDCSCGYWNVTPDSRFHDPACSRCGR